MGGRRSEFKVEKDGIKELYVTRSQVSIKQDT